MRRALADGSLPAERLDSYFALRRELCHLELRLDEHAQREQKRRDKAIHKAMRHYQPRG